MAERRGRPIEQPKEPRLEVPVDARLARLVIGLALLLAACGTDDGASVRQPDATGTATGTGTGSASVTPSASPVAVPCNPVGDAATADTTLEVELLDRDIILGSAQVEAGTVTLEISNNGTELHELVVVRADDPAKLPLDADGRVAIGKLPKGAFVGEVEPWSADLACTGTFELKAGRYALFCNIVETEADGTRDSHYANGMRAALRVRR